MTALLSPRIWLALAIVAVFAAINFASYRAGQANVRAEWVADKLATSELSRQREKSLTIATRKVDHDLQIDKQRLAVSSRATADSLRDLDAAIAERDHPPATSGINGTGGLERELLGSCAASLTELAITSDRLESKVVNLQAYVKNVCLQATVSATQ